MEAIAIPTAPNAIKIAKKLTTNNLLIETPTFLPRCLFNLQAPLINQLMLLRSDFVVQVEAIEVGSKDWL